MKLTAYCAPPVPCGRWRAKTLLKMKLTLLFLLCAVFYAHAEGLSQTVTISVENTRLIDVLNIVKKQSGYLFFYNESELKDTKLISITARSVHIDSFMRRVLADQALQYAIEDKTIVISSVKPSTKPEPPKASFGVDPPPPFKVYGTVIDNKSREPIAQASINVKGTRIGTSTDAKGEFEVSANAGDILVVSFIGYDSKEITVSRSIRLTVSLSVSDRSMKDIVITGLFTRKTESFTGSTATYSQKELLEVGNKNIVRSLANLDPSFRIVDNLQLGSDPNRLPDIQLRGQTGLPDLNNEYASNPNLPLFILDGFETNLQRVIDLDMYLVKSITLLKDAASKSVYGSRAANGVVVIETIRPAAGELQVTYNANLTAEIPDISSYELTTAKEKLNVEMAADPVWNASPADPNARLSRLRYYQPIIDNVERGVNTYWLAQPLRNGIGQRQSLTLGGGDQVWRYYVELGYNDIKGVMKGSGRQVSSAGVTLTYRHKKVSVSNILRLTRSKAENSPLGNFQAFAQMNPYLELYDSIGRYSRSNPLWNSNVGVRDFSINRGISNNVDININLLPSLRFNGRLGINSNTIESDVFLPAAHNSFPALTPGSGSTGIQRGSYSKSDAEQMHLSGTATVSYNRNFGSGTLHANVGTDANEAKRNSYSFAVVGFPSPRLDYPAAAIQYLPQSRLGGSENITRDAGLFGSLNFVWRERFLFDATWRASRSSQFGIHDSWGKFWSLGAGWNLHNEPFFQSFGFLNQLRITANTGFTGSQPLNAYVGLPTYSYLANNIYYGEYAATLMGIANPTLRAQRKHDNNISLNIGLLNNRLNVVADYYIAYTDGLLTDINVPYSNGFQTYKENLGKVENQGFEIRINYRVWANPSKNNFASVFVNSGHNKSKLTQISNSLIALTSREDGKMSSSPKQRFEVGQSMTAIWAVPSLGIDPSNGREVYLKKNGSYTYLWDAADQVVAGDDLAKVFGNFGFNIRYNGWQFNTSFAYKYGGQKYNQTVVDKVENADLRYNVDKRVFTSRWRNPGDVTYFKSIADGSTTYPTSRFVEDWNELSIAAINVSYDLDLLSAIKKIGFKRLRAALILENGFVFSNVRMERGTSYPFARTFSFSLQTMF